MTQQAITDQLLREIRQELREANRWLQMLAAQEVRGRLEPVLAAGQERRVYQASDGSAREVVAKAAGVSHGTVSNYWRKWEMLRIVEETETRGRYRRLFDLREVGIPLVEKEARDARDS
jgi:CRP-like cAMP-binding protein